MSTKVEVRWFLEEHPNEAFCAKELLGVILSGEPRIRKALNELSDEGIIECHQGEILYYGFVGVPCEYRSKCGEFVEGDDCLKRSFMCRTRQDMEDKELEEEVKDVTEAE